MSTASQEQQPSQQAGASGCGSRLADDQQSPSGEPRFAITGASGFVGRQLVRRLQREGQVTAVTRYRAGDPAAAVHVASYADVTALRRVFAGHQVVVHLAARAHRVVDGDRLEAERAFREANVEAARCVAQAASQAGVGRLLLVSSIGVLGSRTNGTPFSDASPPGPTELYAHSKLEGERAVAEALAGSATEWVVLRPPLVYGPGAPGNFGLLMGLVRRLPVVPLGGLHRRRNLISVGNLCDAIAMAVAHPKVAGRSFVLADEEAVSVAEIARALAVGFGRSPRSVFSIPELLLRTVASLVGRAASVSKLADELLVDASGFRSTTGWRPPERAHAALSAAARSPQDAASAADTSVARKSGAT